MSDDLKTIEHNPLERHRGKPVRDRPREPFFGAGLFPLVLTVVVGLVIARYVVSPLVSDWKEFRCAKLYWCTTDQLTSAHPAG